MFNIKEASVLSQALSSNYSFQLDRYEYNTIQRSDTKQHLHLRYRFIHPPFISFHEDKLQMRLEHFVE